MYEMIVVILKKIGLSLSNETRNSQVNYLKRTKQLYFCYLPTEKGYCCVDSVGQLDFDCHTCCGRSRRMQGICYLPSFLLVKREYSKDGIVPVLQWATTF